MAPVDALQHHDGGVEHHADRKRNARQEMILRVRPITLSRQKVSMMLMGMAIAIIRVALSWRRKTQRMAQESSTPSPRLAVTMLTARLM